MANRGLGKRVKELRLARLLTQKQMAVAMGISRATFIRIEDGKSVSELTRSKVERFLKSQQTVQAA